QPSDTVIGERDFSAHYELAASDRRSANYLITVTYPRRSPMKKPPEGGFFMVPKRGLQLRAGGLDRIGNLEFLEVFDELLGQALRRLV
ncbi:hypothetical protein ACNQO9_19125, partial [Acinetobacter calcoaceticus]